VNHLAAVVTAEVAEEAVVVDTVGEVEEGEVAVADIAEVEAEVVEETQMKVKLQEVLLIKPSWTESQRF